MDYIYELLNLAMDHGIGVQLDNNMKPTAISWCEPSMNFIMVNMNYNNQQQIPFQFAHELGHILNGDTSATKLGFTCAAYSKPEYQAHKTAIKLLMKLYVEKNHELNYLKFMEFFNIPDRLEDVAQIEMYKYI